MHRLPSHRLATLVMILAIPFAAFGSSVAKARGGGSSIDWQLSVAGHDRVQVRVQSPSGDVYSFEFKSGQTPNVRLQDLGSELEDGAYNYELRVFQKVSADVAKKLEKARAAGDDAAAKKIARDAGLTDLVQSGAFTVSRGSIVDTEASESLANDGVASIRESGAGPAAAAAQRPGQVGVNDQVIPDDLIVQGSGCFGFDCVNNENFGFDTIRLKENNLRIKAEDTSVGTFPSNDWQLTFNDSASGGSNKFSVEDITGARVPMTIEAGATTNSVFVDSTGRIGFRTSTPVLDLHVNTSNTPGIRLEQNNSGGFTAQTWDIAGNEANFFVRDVTGGSRLPFRIRPGAPTSSIDIAADGDVGIGTASPARKLHVTTTGAADNTVLEIQNDGAARIRITNSANAETWNLGHQSPAGTGLVLSDVGDAVSEMLLDVAGNMTIAGTLTQGSSRAIKNNLELVDPAAALEGVRNLPIMTWSYKDDQNATRHLGPTAEEFHSAFGLGSDDKHIAPGDQAGLALAAIQGLAKQVEEKDHQIQVLQERLAAIESVLKDRVPQP